MRTDRIQQGNLPWELWGYCNPCCWGRLCPGHECWSVDLRSPPVTKCSKKYKLFIKLFNEMKLKEFKHNFTFCKLNKTKNSLAFSHLMTLLSHNLVPGHACISYSTYLVLTRTEYRYIIFLQLMSCQFYLFHIV